MKTVCQLVEPAMFASLLFVAGETAGVKSCQSQKQS